MKSLEESMENSFNTHLTSLKGGIVSGDCPLEGTSGVFLNIILL